eukprot:2379877-Pyramimonas_sp.AAC.1
MKAFYQQLKVPGEAKLVVRHLGADHQTDGWEYHEDGQRQKVAGNGWSTMGHFWGQKGIPMKIKRPVFLGLVYNSHLSGGEAWLPTQQLRDQ